VSAPHKQSKPPAPPKDLQATGRETWALLWTLPHVVYPGDLLAIARLCRIEDEAAALRTKMLESGSVLERAVQNSKGEVIGREPFTHPAALMLRRIGAEAAELCNSLGLSPAARQDLGIEFALREPDWLDELQAKREVRRAAAAIRGKAVPDA
jgi:P27 family predicted phage terminase small subunit